MHPEPPSSHAPRVVHPDATRTEMTWIVMPGDCNALGTAFGGRVLAWIDVCAAISAQRFTRSNVLTAAMDQIGFRAPIRQGKIAVLQSMVNWSGRTSMEVGVRVEEECPETGERTHTSAAYVTFVAVDSELQPIAVPKLVPRTDLESRRYREALQRREDRLAHRARIREGRSAS